MVEDNDTNNGQNAIRFPSEEAHAEGRVEGDSRRPARKRISMLKTLFYAGSGFLLLLMLAAGGLFWVLSSRSVSNEQLRARVESQISTLLGQDILATIGDAKIAIGHGGLLAIDASEVKFLGKGQINLGVAREIAVKVKPVPLLTGDIVAESIAVNGATVAVDFLMTGEKKTGLRPAWPRSIDFSLALQSIGETIRSAVRSIDEAGLESVQLNDTVLVGFDRLGLRSPTARLVSVNVTKAGDGGDHYTFNADLETQFGNWKAAGSWQRETDGQESLTIDINGLQLQDLMGTLSAASSGFSADSSLKLHVIAPFNSDGTPQQATVRADVGEGSVALANKPLVKVMGGELVFRLMPGKNQIDIERSTVRFDGSEAKFVGGLRYPKSDDDPISNEPAFRIVAESFQAFGLDVGKNPPEGRFLIEGTVDPLAQSIQANRISLTTPQGRIEGRGEIRMDEPQPHLKFDLAMPSMPVDEVKQFWPSLLAPNTRQWVNENLYGGVVKNAWVKGDFPPGLFGDDAAYLPENLSASFPISNTLLRTPEKLPPISQARGTVDVRGTKTDIRLSQGIADLGRFGRLKVGESTLVVGSYVEREIPAKLDLSLTGPVAAMAQLTSLEPLNYARQLGLAPEDISGSAKARVSADLLITKILKIGKKPWHATVNISNGRSKAPISGRKLSHAKLVIKADPTDVFIAGTARLDGNPIELSMSQSLDGDRQQRSAFVLKLNDKARRRMGLDTGKILTGPVTVSVENQKDGTQLVKANIRQAVLDLPWIGWRKGVGIQATATFNMKQAKGRTTLSNLRLKGNGFSVQGFLEFDKRGLVKGVLKNVVLNKTDDFDVSIVRSRNIFKISLNARTYDGRALIRSFLSAENSEPGSGATVSVEGRVGRLIGFGGQSLSNVTISFLQKGQKIQQAIVNAIAEGNAPTVFALAPSPGGMQTDISTSNAGSVLRFLDLYSRMRNGTISAKLVRDSTQVFRGRVVATNFTLLDEPRLAQLLRKPVPPENFNNRQEVVRRLRSIPTDRAQIDQLQATIEKGEGFLNIQRGRLTGGDASAAFDGQVYDRNNRMNIKGTYLPGRGLNRLVSKIPLIGLAFGKGKVNGLLGITFKLSGRYGNPTLQVNPLSIIAPGVFRQIFKF